VRFLLACRARVRARARTRARARVCVCVCVCVCVVDASAWTTPFAHGCTVRPPNHKPPHTAHASAPMLLAVRPL
jgi:hypothetical protein